MAQDLLNVEVDLFLTVVRTRMQNQRKGAMEIIQKEEYGITCLKIKGRMDMAVAIETEKAVDRILKGNNNRLLFDLGELEYLSSYGLRIILKAAKKIKMMDGKIILCSLLETDKEFFDICGFGANIPIADSVESGIKVLS